MWFDMEKPHTHSFVRLVNSLRLVPMTQIIKVTRRLSASTNLSKWSLYQDVNTIISAVKLNILTRCYEVYGDWLGFRASLQWSLEELQLLSLVLDFKQNTSIFQDLQNMQMCPKAWSNHKWKLKPKRKWICRRTDLITPPLTLLRVRTLLLFAFSNNEATTNNYCPLSPLGGSF